MGSTAIIGLPGKPMIYFTVITKGLLPDIPNDCIDELAKIGYIYGGPSPHCMNKSVD